MVAIAAERGPDQIAMTQASTAHNLLYRLISTSPEVFAMVPARLDNSLTRVFHDGLLAAPHGGTRILTSYPDSGRGRARNTELIQVASTAGAEVRTHAALPTWLGIVGRRTVILPRDPDNVGAGLILLHRGSHVRAALWMFAHAWQTASPLPAGNDAISLSRWERRVLAQVATGIKDEAGARRLEVSVRTYRRYVTELCERLGASSRFEAGIRAAQAGLV
jgi:hypothetical protein